MGMERVNLSPIFGIVKSRISNDYNILQFCCPHNEFIAYWTFTGFLGLLAYVSLLTYLIFANIRIKTGYFWNGIYLALFVQMIFDAAFQYPRFIPLFFIIAGLNLRELSFRASNLKHSQPII